MGKNYLITSKLFILVILNFVSILIIYTLEPIRTTWLI